VRDIRVGLARRLAYISPKRGQGGPLAVCAIFRDEARYLAEWVTFHRLHGVERFYLYDNRSSDNWRQVLAPEITSGVVTVRRWPYVPGQNPAYTDCLKRRPNDEWVAFIDIDEFLFSPTGRPLPAVLSEFRQHPGVTVNWRTFGTGGHLYQPPGLVTESYVTRAADNRWVNLHVKSIVQPGRTQPHCPHPHVFDHHGQAVGEDHKPQSGPFRDPPTADLLRINHYFAKSEEELQRKLVRGGVAPRIPVDSERRVFDDVRDETILRFVPALKSAIADRY
jgi:glycosyl transferase family 92